MRFASGEREACTRIQQFNITRDLWCLRKLIHWEDENIMNNVMYHGSQDSRLVSTRKSHITQQHTIRMNRPATYVEDLFLL